MSYDRQAASRTGPSVFERISVRATCDVSRRLCAAAISDDRKACARLMATLIEDGMSPDTIADHYLPQVARILGEAWCEDQMNWADVSIGTARLQGLLHHIPVPPVADAARTVLVLSGPDTAHTLGPVLLTHQLRRRGFSVALSMETAVGDVRALYRRINADVVFVSTSHAQSLEYLSKVVKEIRVFNSGASIVVGGPLLDAVPDLRKLIGADHATSDVTKALALCGLTAPSIRQPG